MSDVDIGLVLQGLWGLIAVLLITGGLIGLLALGVWCQPRRDLE